MIEKNEIDVLLDYEVQCVDCGEYLGESEDLLKCSLCTRLYETNSAGVWDFRKSTKDEKTLEFYQEINYQKWKEVFEKQEVHDWVIYKTSFRRFFAQAGHRVINKFLQNTKYENTAILEIGAGTGALLKDKKLGQYIGIDHSLSSLSALKVKNPTAITLCTSGIDIPFSDGVFETIVSLHTLEHIYYIAEHIEEVKRVMVDGGRYLYVIPTEGGISFWLGRQMITGPYLKTRYNLNVNSIMQREHINDARRVLKFLRFYFPSVSKSYWPLKFPILSINAMIYGECVKHDDPKT